MKASLYIALQYGLILHRFNHFPRPDSNSIKPLSFALERVSNVDERDGFVAYFLAPLPGHVSNYGPRAVAGVPARSGGNPRALAGDRGRAA